jgi:hypothetical protein
MPRAPTVLLAATALAVGTLAAAQSIEHQRIEYERQQREYWRAQEERQREEQRRQQMYDEQCRRDEASKDQFKLGSGTPGAGGEYKASASYGAGGDAAAEIEALRRKLEKQPALAPERNPLLGQWRMVPRTKAGAIGGLGELMAMVTGAACEMLLGDGIWDFQPQAIHSIDKGIGATELDKTECRGNGSTVAVLPRRFVRLMVFEMQPPNRAKFVLGGDGTVPNSKFTRLDARGSGCDDPRLHATLYDFDIHGVLRSVTYVWSRPAGPAPAPIFSERVKTLSIHHPGLPQPQSPGRLQADTSLGRLVLQDMPERNLLLEAYAAAR